MKFLKRQKKPNIEIIWYQPDERSQGRDGPEFYCEGGSHTLVCSVQNTGTGASVEIFCDGEMRYSTEKDVARDSDRLIALGVTDDNKVNEGYEKDYFSMNPWFDAYTNEGEHLDCVTHSLNSALDFAVERIS